MNDASDMKESLVNSYQSFISHCKSAKVSYPSKGAFNFPSPLVSFKNICLSAIGSLPMIIYLILFKTPSFITIENTIYIALSKTKYKMLGF